MFLRAFEGAFTADEYDKLEEDERDLLLVYISELKMSEIDKFENKG